MSQEHKPTQTGNNLPQFRSVALIAMGGNHPSLSGDPTATILLATQAIQKDIGVIRSRSRLFRTPAFPAGSGPDFVNAALSVETDLKPAELISALHRAEVSFGRIRNERWAPRTLDLDLIGMDDLVLPDPETHREWRDLTLEEQMSRAPDQLIVPHPRVQERAFVLVPLAEVAPDWVHPVLGKTVCEMRDALPQALLDEVQAL